MDVRTEVTFEVRDEKVERLMEMAREMDERQGNDTEDSYTVPQALQLVWHNEPDWLVTEGILGAWLLERAAGEDGVMRPVWHGKGE